jgi:hypothetical protein
MSCSRAARYWEYPPFMELSFGPLEAFGHIVERLFFDISFPRVEDQQQIGWTLIVRIYVIYYQ